MRPRLWQPESEVPLVHGWDGPYDIPRLVQAREPARALAVAGSIMPPDEIRRRSTDWRHRPLETPEWQLLETPNADVRGDVPLEALRSVGAYAEELNVVLRLAIGGVQSRSRFLFRIFNKQQDFRKFATLSQAANAESLYDPRSFEAVLWFGTYASPELFQRGFAHEFTHAFMDLVWKRTDPLWFAEGMAEYFSDLEWKNGTLVPGQINPVAINLLKAEPWAPLGELFRFGRDVLYSVRFPYLYAQSWSVIHFMFAKMPEVVVKILEHGGAGVPNPEAIEPEWQTYVEELLGKA